MLITFLIATGFFGVCFLIMGIGVLFKDLVLKSSCGGTASLLGKASCTCAKKEKKVCSSDDDTGLIDMSQLGNPQRVLDPKHIHGESFEV